jgi:hypothetical protein
MRRMGRRRRRRRRRRRMRKRRRRRRRRRITPFSLVASYVGPSRQNAFAELFMMPIVCLLALR